VALAELADAVAPMDDVAIAHRGTVADNDPVFDMVARAETTTKMEEKILAFYIHLLPHIICRRGQN